MTFNELLDKYRAISLSEHDKGSRFELLMKNFLLTYPEYREKISNVWLWNDFDFRNDFGGKDVGIDIVAKTFDGDFWAVQCKCYAESTRIDKPAVDWQKLDAGTFGEGAIKKFREILLHQRDAINATQIYLQNNEHGKLIMTFA